MEATIITRYLGLLSSQIKICEAIINKQLIELGDLVLAEQETFFSEKNSYALGVILIKVNNINALNVELKTYRDSHDSLIREIKG